MASDKKGNGKIWAVVFFLFFIEFLYIVFSKQAPQPCPIKVDGTVQNLIDELYCPIDISTQKKVLTYLADANDQSGDIKNMGKETVLNLSIAKIADPNFIKSVKESIKVTGVKFVATRGKQSQDLQPADDEIRQTVDNSSEVPNDIFTIETEKITEKGDYIEIPVQLNFKRTGFYKFDYAIQLNRISIEENTMKIGKIKLDLSLSKDKIDKEQLIKKWNNLSGSMYFCVVDATKPQEDVKKIPVSVVPK
jgi:hypothetical protein